MNNTYKVLVIFLLCGESFSLEECKFNKYQLTHAHKQMGMYCSE